MFASEKPVPVATLKPVCPAIEHVCVSQHDTLTDATAEAIEGNNLARAKLCGPPPQCMPKQVIASKAKS